MEEKKPWEKAAEKTVSSKTEKKPWEKAAETTVEKKNLIPNEQTAINQVSSTESLTPTSVSESESVGVTQPISSVSQNPTTLRDITNIREQQRVPQPTPEVIPQSTEGLSGTPNLSGGQKFRANMNPVENNMTTDDLKLVFDNKYNYNKLEPKNREIASNLIEDMYKDVYDSKVNKTDVTEDEVGQYILEKTKALDISEEEKQKITNAVNENLFGNNVSEKDGSFKQAKDNYLKEERERDIKDTYTQKYGENLDMLVEDLSIGTTRKETKTTATGLKEVDSDLISSKTHTLRPESIDALLKGNNNFDYSSVTGVYTQLPEGEKGSKLSSEEAVKLYESGKVKFEDPSRKDIFFGAYKEIANPKIVKRNIDKTKQGEIVNALGIRDKQYSQLSKEEKALGFKKFEDNIDKTLESVPSMYGENEIEIKSGYDELITINNTLTQANKEVADAKSKFEIDQSIENRLELSKAQTKANTIQSMLDGKSTELESKKEAVLGYSTQLFDPKTGELLSEQDEVSTETMQWNKDLISKTEKYTEGYAGSLKEAKANQYLKLKYLQNQILSDSRFNDEAKKRAKNLELFDYALKNDDLVDKYKDAWTELKAITRAEALNIDVKDIPRSKTEAFAEGFTEAMSDLGGLGKDLYTQREVAEDFIKVAGENGIKVTKEQEDRLKQSIGEEALGAIGGSLPAMIELGLATRGMNVSGAKKSLEGIFGAVKAMKKIAKKPALVKTIDFIEKATINGLEFELGGQTFATGVGESAGKSLAESIKLPGGFSKYLIKTPVGRVFLSAINGTVKTVAGATGQTVEEYTGEFFDELSRNGLTEAWATTIGDDPWRKLIVMYAVSGTLGMASMPKEYKDAYKKIETDILDYKGSDPEILRVQKSINDKRNTVEKVVAKEKETATPETTGLGTSEPLTTPTEETVTEKPIPTITTVEGAETSYTTPEGDFLKESEVIELANNNDPRLSSLTLQNPSQAITDALAPKTEQVVTNEEVITEEVVPTPTSDVVTEVATEETAPTQEITTDPFEGMDIKETSKGTDATIVEKNPSGEVNSTNRKTLGKVIPNSPRQALLQMFTSGTKIDKETMSKETGFGITDSKGNKRGKTEQNKLGALIAKEGEKGTPLDSIVEQMQEMFPEGQTFDEQSVINEIIDILNTHENTTSMAQELLDDYSYNGVIYSTLEAKGEAMEIDEQNKLAEDMQEWEAKIEEEARNSEEEVAKYIEENKFDEYLKTATDEELEKYYGPEAVKREVAKPNTKTESGINDAKGKNGATTKPKVDKPSPLRKSASSLRDMAAKIRESQKGTLNSAIISPELFAKALDTLATLLEKADDAGGKFMDAVNEFKKSKEYNDLNKSDKEQIDEISKAQVEANNETFESEPKPKKEKAESTEKKSKKEVRTVTQRFIDAGGLTEEQAEAIAELSKRTQASNPAKMRVAKDLVAEVGLEKAYELTTNKDTESVFSQETKNYVAISYVNELKNRLNKTDNVNEKKVLTSRIADIMSKVSLEAKIGGEISAFWNEIYKEYPEMKTDKSVIDILNEKNREVMDSPSQTDGKTVEEEINDTREVIKEELRKELEEEVEALKERVRELEARKAETKKDKIARIDKKIDSYKADLKKAFSGKSSSASSSIIGLNNEAITAIAGLVSSYIEKGIVNTKSIIDKVFNDVKEVGGDVTREQIEEIANKNSDYSKAKVEGVVNNEGKNLTNKEIKEAFESYFIDSTSTKASLVEHLADKLGLTKSEAKSIAGDLEARVEKKVREVATTELTKNLKKETLTVEEKEARAKKMKEARKLVNKVTKSVMLGDLSSQDFKNAFAEKYDIPVITEAEMSDLTELVRLSKIFEEKGQRELYIKAQRRINTTLRNMKAKDAKYYSGVIMELAYLNALSGINTQANANIGALSTSLLNGIAKTLDEALVKRNPLAVAYGLRAMAKSIKAASSSAKDARKFNYSKYTDYGSYTEGATALEMGVIEDAVIKGAARYFRAISKDSSISENTKNLMKGIGVSILQYSRLNFLLNASDAFLTTQFSEFNAAIETYNNEVKNMGVSKLGRLVDNKSLVKTLDEKMGYTSRSEFESKADNEIEAEKQRIEAEVDALDLDPRAAYIEKQKRINESISKGFKNRRVQELMEQSRDRQIQERAVRTAKDWIMLSDPDGVFGMINEGLKRIMTGKETDEGPKSVLRTMLGLTIMFSRMTFNTMNAVMTNIPLIGMIPSTIGISKTNDGWKFGYKGKVDKDLMRRRLLTNAIMTSVGGAVFAEMFEWDDEDEEYKLDPNRLIDITVGGYGPNQIEKNQQSAKGYKGMGLAVSFRSSPDKEFDSYRSIKLLPQAMPVFAILGNLADKSKGLGTEKSNDKNIIMSSLGVSVNQLLEGSFNSIGRTTKAVQMSQPENSLEVLGSAAFELVTSPIKNITQPNFYRDAINETGIRGDVKKKYPKDLWGKLTYDYYGLDASSENKTDIFGDEYKTQSKVMDWYRGEANDNYDENRWKLLFKYPEVNVTTYKAPDDFTTKLGKATYAYEVIDETVKDELSLTQKKKFKDLVEGKYESLDKLNSEDLQKKLNKLRTESIDFAKKEISKKYKGDESKIKKIK